MQASSTTWAHTMTIQKLELYIHVVDIQHFICCRRPTSLVPRPLPPRKKGPGIYCSRMHEIIARMYGKGSVNVSVNSLSHMARS